MLGAVERFGEGLSPLPWIRNEHLSRFEFAATYVKDKVVLDCACGQGIGTKRFAQAGAAYVHAFDVDEDVIRRLAAANTAPNVSFRSGNAANLPLEAGSIDVYVSLETVEHVQEDVRFMEEARRVLKPGGLFICSTPNREITNPGTRITDAPWNKFHVREYEQAEFKALLSRFFSSVEIFGQNPTNPVKRMVSRQIARTLSPVCAVRFNQICKLPLFVFDRIDKHQVLEYQRQKFEYLVAVCKVD